MPKGRYTTKEEMKEWVDKGEAYKAMGGKLKEFCLENNLNKATFYDWRRRLLNLSEEKKERKPYTKKIEAPVTFEVHRSSLKEEILKEIAISNRIILERLS